MWPPVSQQNQQPAPRETREQALLRELQALEHVQDQVVAPMIKALAEVGQYQVPAGARGTNKVPHLPGYLRAQAPARPFLDTLTLALSPHLVVSA